jgi:membrane peptidoglycan carboxypeptidase
MKSISRTLQIRHKRTSRQVHSPLGRLGLGCSAIFSLAILLVIFAALAGYTSLTRELPSLQALPGMLNPLDGSLLQPTRLYDRSGEQVILTLEDPGAAGREYLPLEAMPQSLVDAYLAVYEPGFWDSPGYTLQGIGEDASSPAGDQTLAQRLVSDFLLWNEQPSLRRSLRERLLAAQLVRRYGHEQVLEWSLNSAQFGPLIYGADAGARTFFGKSATELDLSEAAFLVAAAQSPGIHPLEAPQVVLERQESVLHSMLFQGTVSPIEAAQAIQENHAFRDRIPPSDLAPAFTNLVLEQLSEYIPLERLERGGLRVITSLDYDLQIQALCATIAYQRRLQGEQGSEVAIDGQPCQAARLLPTLPLQEQAASGELATNAVVLEPATGQILAMVGDLTPGTDPVQPPGQVGGSLLTPFVYLTGFTRGLGPASLVWDLPATQPFISEAGDKPDLSGYQGPLRLRTALANDNLAPALHILQQLGAETVLRLTRGLGLDSLKSLSGTAEEVFDQPVVLLDIAHAYSIFANGGILAGQPQNNQGAASLPGNGQQSLEPAAVLSVEDLTGQSWLDLSTTQKHAILSPQLAYLMTDVLSDETARWPSLGHPNPLEIGRPVGAKLGISSDASSAWSVGFTPQRLAAVWMGNPQGSQEPVALELPAALWHALMQYATKDLSAQDWEMPAGVSKLSVCDPSGMLPTDLCPNVVTEVFLNGSEPLQQDTLYQAFQVNRETGQLATVFTPAEMVEERIFEVLPVEALDWARQAGIPIAPDTYDAIYTASQPSADLSIDSPAMFGHITGRVPITGRASGEDFSFYRLQAGQGLNPQTWLTISEDINTPVENGLLGEWQTEGLEGLYTLQLLLVRQDQSVEKTVLQVTIDNTPPLLSINNPSDGQQIKVVAGKKVLLQAEAFDDLQLSRVEFYVDERLVATLKEAPYNILWQGMLGKHTLKAIAYDLAGNQAQDSIEFELLR